MKNLWFTSQLDGLNFTEEEVATAVQDNKMLNLTLYISAICNVKCPSCFISNVDDDFPELNVSNYDDILNQASELEIKSIKISGAGEPLILKDTLHIVEKCSSFGIIPIVYTNGTTLGDHQLCKTIYNCDSYELIDILKRNKVSLVYKFNSGTDKIQDFMLGKESYSSKTYRGIFNLFYKGYNLNNKLAFQSIITPYNYAEAENLYRFCRNNNVVPYFETVLKRKKQPKIKIYIFLMMKSKAFF